MRITDVSANCNCGWSGIVFDCTPDVNGEGDLGCPNCSSIINVIVPEQKTRLTRITFRNENSLYSDDPIAWIEMDNIFVPGVGDSVHLQENEATLSFGWIVSERRFTYNIDIGGIDITIWLKQEYNEKANYFYRSISQIWKYLANSIVR